MEKEFSPMEAFTCKVIFLKDEREVEDAIVILKVEKDESDPEMESYVGVESEEILREVFGQFLEKMKAGEKV